MEVIDIRRDRIWVMKNWIVYFKYVTLPEYCIREIKKARDAGIGMYDIDKYYFDEAIELSCQAVLSSCAGRAVLAERSGDAELIAKTRDAVITVVNELFIHDEPVEKPRSRLKVK